MKKPFLVLTAVAFVATAALTLNSCSASEDKVPLCDGTEYNESTEFCHANTIYEKCSDRQYNPDNKECIDGRIVDKGGNQNPSSSSSGGTTTPSSNSIGDNACKVNNQQVFCQWETGCFESNSEWDPDKRSCSAIIADCKEFGLLFTGVASANVGEGKKCNGTPVIPGNNEAGRCFNNNKPIFCQWPANGNTPSSCWGISSGTENGSFKTCANKIADCSALYTDVDLYSVGEGVSCADKGGILISGGISSSSSGTASEGSCKVDNKDVFCEWAGGCYEQNAELDPDKKSCSVMLADCRRDGLLFTGVASANIGDGKRCNGTPVTTSGNEVGRCFVGNQLAYCEFNEWEGEPGGCYQQQSTATQNCTATLSKCLSDGGTLYIGIDLYNSAFSEANGYGKGSTCSGLGGTVASLTN